MSRLTALWSRVDGLLRSHEVESAVSGDEKSPVVGPVAAPGRGEDPRAERAAGHAPGHQHLGPPPKIPGPRGLAPTNPPRHQAWQDTGGRVDRLRRNERHGDESGS